MLSPKEATKFPRNCNGRYDITQNGVHAPHNGPPLHRARRPFLASVTSLTDALSIPKLTACAGETSSSDLCNLWLGAPFSPTCAKTILRGTTQMGGGCVCVEGVRVPRAPINQRNVCNSGAPLPFFVRFVRFLPPPIRSPVPSVRPSVSVSAAPVGPSRGEVRANENGHSSSSSSSSTYITSYMHHTYIYTYVHTHRQTYTRTC